MARPEYTNGDSSYSAGPCNEILEVRDVQARGLR